MLFCQTLQIDTGKIVLFGQTIQIDAGNENADNKITNNSSDHLQDLPKLSFGEKLVCYLLFFYYFLYIF